LLRVIRISNLHPFTWTSGALGECSFTIYLTMLSVTQTIQPRIIEWFSEYRTEKFVEENDLSLFRDSCMYLDRLRNTKKKSVRIVRLGSRYYPRPPESNSGVLPIRLQRSVFRR
jgi:hypothetical protein